MKRISQILRNLFPDTASRILLGLFGVTLFHLVTVQILNVKGTNYNYINTLLISIIITFGSVVGFWKMRQWGGWVSPIGKCSLFISLALLAWSVGSWAWVYYNFFLRIEVPYPSIADFGYLSFYPLFGIGIVMLTHLTTVKNTHHNIHEKIIFFCIPLMMAVVTYYFIFIQLHGGEVAEDSAVKTFFDLFYPMSDILILAIIILSFSLIPNYLGEKIKTPYIILIVGLIANYLADLNFSYSTTIGTYYISSFGDFLFTLAMFTLSWGVCLLHPRLVK